MGSVSAASEIVELKEELDLADHSKRLNPIKVKRREIDVSGKHILPMSGRSSIEEELNKLIEAIDLKTRGLRYSHQSIAPPSCKNPEKRPISVGIAQSSGIGITEAVTLKQALRGLCISQASELAALKRLTKSGGLSRASEGGTIKRLSRAVAVEGIVPGPLSGGGDGCSLVEVSVTVDSNTTHLTEGINNSLPALKMGQMTRSNASSPSLTARSKEIPHMEHSEKMSNSSSHSEDASTEKPLQIRNSSSLLIIECKMPDTLSAIHGMQDSPSPSTWNSNRGSAVRKSATSLEAIRNSFKNKEYVKKKMNQNLKSASTRGSSFTGADNKTSGSIMQKLHPVHLLDKNPKKESPSPSSFGNSNIEVSSGAAVVVPDVKPAITLQKPSIVNIVSNKTGRLNSSDKSELSHSSDSSLGECSSSTSISDESSISILSCGGSRPHMSKDLRWVAIRHIEMQHGNLGLRNFKLLKRLGCGDIGTVYLAELTGTTCLFALKVMDNNFLVTRKKMPRAQTEREILQMLDHPFLPTLYTHFTTENLSCLAMEYCPGGDLHVLRQKQAGRFFSEQAARFYVAEVLLALEYLHMLGVIYRDLKPENILVREDGHIMLSDFDLSLRCAVCPTLLKPSSPSRGPDKRQMSFCSEAPCIDPLCLQPSWSQISCFTPRLLTSTTKTQRLRPETASGQVIPLPQLVAEPTEARSNSFVGTHEYLAPEIIRGEGHGSAVDWWTLGIFLFELLFGVTPFKGLGNEETLANVVSNSLNFPESPPVSLSAKDLIRGLLVKVPENRLGFTKGSTEIKQHPFFEGLNWALIRCAVPPEIPTAPRPGALNSWLTNDSKSPKVRSIGDHLKFEVF